MPEIYFTSRTPSDSPCLMCTRGSRQPPCFAQCGPMCSLSSSLHALPSFLWCPKCVAACVGRLCPREPFHQENWFISGRSVQLPHCCQTCLRLAQSIHPDRSPTFLVLGILDGFDRVGCPSETSTRRQQTMHPSGPSDIPEMGWSLGPLCALSSSWVMNSQIPNVRVSGSIRCARAGTSIPPWIAP